MAKKLKRNTAIETVNINIIIAGASALVSGESPRAARQRLEAFLEPKAETE